jgi:hypothetical protein
MNRLKTWFGALAFNRAGTEAGPGTRRCSGSILRAASGQALRVLQDRLSLTMSVPLTHPEAWRYAEATGRGYCP